ncbi:MAG: phosphohistidine phosphatase SixA [Pseudohongiellaceae bacterium]
MIVYLFRHGEAEAKAAKDAERPLTRKGVMDTREVAKKFLARAPMIDKALMSPYERAKQTAVSLRQGFPSLRFEINQLLLPEADIYEMLEALGNMGAHQIMLVGHNPNLSRLMALMLDGITDTGRELGAGELVAIAMDDAEPGFGSLLYNIRPGDE